LNAIAYQAGELARNTVIEELASLRFLPRYGFPIGVQALRVPPNSFGRNNNASVKLERDGVTALSEYVPGSQLLAGGRIFSSHGLARSFDKNGGNFGITYFRFECNAGHVLYKTQRDLTNCMEGVHLISEVDEREADDRAPLRVRMRSLGSSNVARQR